MLPLLPALLALAAHADAPYLRYLPADTRAVLTIRPAAMPAEDRKAFEALVRGVFRRQFVPSLADDDGTPFGEIDAVVLAQAGVGSLHGVVLVHGKIDRAALLKRIGPKNVARVGTPAAAVAKRPMDFSPLLKNVPSLKSAPPFVAKLIFPNEAHLCVLDDKTFMLSTAGRVPVERALRARGDDSLRLTSDLAKLLRKEVATDVACFAMLDNALTPLLALGAGDAVRNGFDAFDHLVGATRREKRFAVDLAVTAKSAEQADLLEKAAADILARSRADFAKVLPDESMREPVGKLLAAAKITRKDNRVALRAEVSLDDVRMSPKPKK